jgi:hypothetical protein
MRKQLLSLNPPRNQLSLLLFSTKNRRMQNRLLIVCLFVSTILFCQQEPNVTHLNAADLPAGIIFKGQLVDAVRWTDSIGDNIVVTSETGEYPGKITEEEKTTNADLFATHYLVDSDSVRVLWKVTDHVRNCPVDLSARFLGNTFHVTDLDSDGTGEVWLMYKTACRSDVSPATMKIILYEGAQKYAVRGENKVKVSETEYDGGDYKMDPAFEQGPKVFRDFAKRLWKTHILETWD